MDRTIMVNHDQILNRIDNSLNSMLRQGMRAQDIAEKLFPGNAKSMRNDNIPKTLDRRYFLEPDYIDVLNIKGWILNDNKSFSRQKISSTDSKEVLQLALLEDGQSVLSQWKNLDMKIY